MAQKIGDCMDQTTEVLRTTGLAREELEELLEVSLWKPLGRVWEEARGTAWLGEQVQEPLSKPHAQACEEATTMGVLEELVEKTLWKPLQESAEEAQANQAFEKVMHAHRDKLLALLKTAETFAVEKVATNVDRDMQMAKEEQRRRSKFTHE